MEDLDARPRVCLTSLMLEFKLGTQLCYSFYLLFVGSLFSVFKKNQFIGSVKLISRL